MKRKKYIPLAITMLLAVPAFLTSCQEDAPEINYTMSVSVINDFTKVVEAIDRGALKNEEAIAKLADAIDRMSSDQQAKLQAIRDVLVSVNTTLETRLIARSLPTLSPAAIMSRVKVPLYPWPPSAPRCHGCDYLQGQRLETVQDVPKNICVNQDNFRTFPLKNCSFLIGRA